METSVIQNFRPNSQVKRLLHRTRRRLENYIKIATRLRAEKRGIGVRFPSKARDLSLLHNIRTGSGDHPVFYPVGTWRSFTGVKRSGERETDHSPPPNSEVKYAWINTSIPPHAFVPQCLIKRRDTFIFYLK
jgi:hypothetical protein